MVLILLIYSRRLQITYLMSNSKSNSFYEENTIESPPLSLKVIRFYLKVLSFISEKRAAQKLVDYFLHPRIDNDKMITRYKQLELFDPELSFYQTYQNHELFMYKEGEPAVLLVHGWESSGHRFQTLMEKLRENNIGFLYFDLPAHGYSEGNEIHAVLAANIVADILTDYPSINSVIGHSFGGGVAYLALEKPNTVKNLVTVGTPMNYKAVTEPFFQIFDTPLAVREQFNILFSNHIDREFENYDLATIELVNDLNHLIIHDRDDRIIPWQDVNRVKEAKPSVEIFITEGLGHRKTMHDENVIDRIVEFISS